MWVQGIELMSAILTHWAISAQLGLELLTLFRPDSESSVADVCCCTHFMCFGPGAESRTSCVLRQEFHLLSYILNLRGWFLINIWIFLFTLLCLTVSITSINILGWSIYMLYKCVVQCKNVILFTKYILKICGDSKLYCSRNNINDITVCRQGNQEPLPFIQKKALVPLSQLQIFQANTCPWNSGKVLNKWEASALKWQSLLGLGKACHSPLLWQNSSEVFLVLLLFI